MPRTLPALPPVTDHHRRAAFTLLSWPDCTFEQAMNNDLKHRVIEACASALRKREWQQARRAVRVVRVPRPATWAPNVQDLKRAAAGDRDD
jgi:hypothetical protein